MVSQTFVQTIFLCRLLFGQPPTTRVLPNVYETDPKNPTCWKTDSDNLANPFKRSSNSAGNQLMNVQLKWLVSKGGVPATSTNNKLVEHAPGVNIEGLLHLDKHPRKRLSRGCSTTLHH